MRKPKRLLIGLLCLALCLTAFVGCGKTDEVVMELGKHYSDQIDDFAAGKYDADLFRINQYGMPKVADPSILVVDDERSAYNGKVLVSGTTSNTAFDMFVTEDFVTYKFAATAFRPHASSWGSSADLWASEYIYDKENGLYYLFYSAQNKYVTAQKVTRTLNVAVAEKPEGPYLEYNEYALRQEAAELGVEVTQAEVDEAVKRPRYDYDEFLKYDIQNLYSDATLKPDFFAAIDPHPFVDPKTGDKYLYFCRDGAAGINHTWLYGVKMTDWATPQYDTLTRMFCTDDGGYESAGNPTTEGPQMTYNPSNGKYYLTFSVNDYNKSDYCVAQAVGNAPLGDGQDTFVKIKRDKGGLIMDSGDTNGKVSGSGHHSFFNYKGQMYAIYHRHSNPAIGGTQRELAVDTVTWVTNPDNLPVLHMNGCTTTLQPAVHSPYTNLALDATVTASGSYANLEAINDGAFITHAYDNWLKEFEANGESATVKFAFGEYRTIAGIMLYNSIDPDKTFDEVTAIKIHTRVDGKPVTYVINNLAFDPSMIEGSNAAVKGSAAVAAFKPVEADYVEIVMNRKYSNQDVLAVSEVVILGK